MVRFAALLLSSSATLTLGVCFSSPAYAQAPASLSGHVTDASGRPGAHAVVRLITDPTSNASVHPQRYTLLGDSLGKFSQEGIAPGAYLVMLSTDGRGTDVLRRVLLEAGEAGVLNLSVGSSAVQVAATR